MSEDEASDAPPRRRGIEIAVPVRHALAGLLLALVLYSGGVAYCAWQSAQRAQEFKSASWFTRSAAENCSGRELIDYPTHVPWHTFRSYWRLQIAAEFFSDLRTLEREPKCARIALADIVDARARGIRSYAVNIHLVHAASSRVVVTWRMP